MKQGYGLIRAYPEKKEKFVPLVAGEPTSPLGRVMIAADSGNGIAVVLDPRRYSFVNADLTVHVHRLPDDEWVCLEAVTTPEASGIGLSTSRLYDRRGPIGWSLQSLLVEARPTTRSPHET